MKSINTTWDGEEPKEESDTNANEKDQEDPSANQ